MATPNEEPLDRKSSPFCDLHLTQPEFEDDEAEIDNRDSDGTASPQSIVDIGAAAFSYRKSCGDLSYMQPSYGSHVGSIPLVSTIGGVDRGRGSAELAEASSQCRADRTGSDGSIVSSESWVQVCHI